MSVNTRQEKALLYRDEEIQTSTGFKKTTKKYIGSFYVSIYKTSEYVSYGSYRHDDITHIGLSIYKNIDAKSDYISVKDKYYKVLSTNTNNRLNQISLKEVIKW